MVGQLEITESVKEMEALTCAGDCLRRQAL